MKNSAKKILSAGLALICALTLALGTNAINAYAYDYEITSATPNGLFATITLSAPGSTKTLNIKGLNSVATRSVVLYNGVQLGGSYHSIGGSDAFDYSFEADTLASTAGIPTVCPITINIYVESINETHGTTLYTRCVTIKANDPSYSYPSDSGSDSDEWLEAEKFATAEAILADKECTVKCEGMDTLDREFVEILRYSTKASLELNFTYDGVAHQVVIPAGKAPTEDLDYYGPLWLIQKYGDRLATPAYTTYVIQNGDSLSKLAKNWGTTISELMKLNPQIKDANCIYIGDTLVH